MLCIGIITNQGYNLWQQLIQRNKVRTSLNILAQSIESTRIIALQHNKSYALCASADGINCSQYWQQGLLVTDMQQQKIKYISHWQLPCKLYFRGRLISNKLIFTKSGFTSGSQGRFYCELAKQHKTYSLLVRSNGSVGDLVVM